MQTYDIIMLVVLGIATFMGAIKGFAWQLASLASIVVSYLAAYFFRNDVAKLIQAQEPWNGFLAMLLIYAVSSFAIWMVFRLLSSVIDQMRLRDFDRHMGALLGLGKGVLLCLLITMFAVTLLGPRQQQAIVDSRSGSYISQLLAAADGIVWPKEIEPIIRPYLDRVEQRLEQRGQEVADVPGQGLEGFLPKALSPGQQGGHFDFGFGNAAESVLPERLGNGAWQLPLPGTPVSTPNDPANPSGVWPSLDNGLNNVLPNWK